MGRLKTLFRVESKAQIKELAKLYLDIGKLTLVVLVLGLIIDETVSMLAKITIGILGLTSSFWFFTIGLKLLKKA